MSPTTSSSRSWTGAARWRGHTVLGTKVEPLILALQRDPSGCQALPRHGQEHYRGAHEPTPMPARLVISSTGRLPQGHRHLVVGLELGRLTTKRCKLRRQAVDLLGDSCGRIWLDQPRLCYHSPQQDPGSARHRPRLPLRARATGGGEEAQPSAGGGEVAWPAHGCSGDWRLKEENKRKNKKMKNRWDPVLEGGLEGKTIWRSPLVSLLAVVSFLETFLFLDIVK